MYQVQSLMDFAYEGRWTAQQIVEAFPWDTVPRYLLRDRDAIYSVAFQQCIKNMGIEEGQDRPTQSLAKSLRRETHREYTSQCARSCHRPQWSASRADAHRLYLLLPPISNLSFS